MKKTDEEKCDGYGLYALACPEGAIQIKEREAEEFDLKAVRQHLESLGKLPEEIQHAIEHARSHLEGKHHRA